MSEKIAVLGSGTWGAVLAKYLCEQGKNVQMWSYSERTANDISNLHKINRTGFEDIVLPSNLKAYTSAEYVLKDADAVVSTIVSHGLREFLRETKQYWPKDVRLLSTTKGLEVDSGKRMSEVFLEELEIEKSQIAILSGPNLAIDVARNLPVVTTVAAYDRDTAVFFQKLFCSKTFRVYTNDDVVGVELNGAMKNVIAIAAGICYGMGLGESIRAGITARAMHEIWRISDKMGADLKTSMGIAGIGDIILTSTARTSRNHKFGERIGRRENIKEIISDSSAVAEGKNAVAAIHNLSKKYDLKTPICEAVYRIINEELSLDEAIEYLLARPELPEFDESYNLSFL